MSSNLKDLSEYRLNQASQCLTSARILHDAQDYKGAANRSYYCIFHAMRSVLALDMVDFARHSGVSAYFRKAYIKTGIFDVEFSDVIKEAFDIRSDSDYDDFYLISKEEVVEQMNHAAAFLDVVTEYLKDRWDAECDP